jgi:heme-degrading monooxygenase HmoA
MMFAILWRFRAAPGKEAEFESQYGSNGTWAVLFARSSAYLGTTLLRDVDGERAYVTIDRWQSRADFDNFRREHAVAYAALDVDTGPLCTSEELLGMFESVDLVRIHQD